MCQKLSSPQFWASSSHKQTHILCCRSDGHSKVYTVISNLYSHPTARRPSLLQCDKVALQRRIQSPQSAIIFCVSRAHRRLCLTHLWHRSIVTRPKPSTWQNDPLGHPFLERLPVNEKNLPQQNKLYQRRPQTEQCSKMRSPNNMASSIS